MPVQVMFLEDVRIHESILPNHLNVQKAAASPRYRVSAGRENSCWSAELFQEQAVNPGILEQLEPAELDRLHSELQGIKTSVHAGLWAKGGASTALCAPVTYYGNGHGTGDRQEYAV